MKKNLIIIVLLLSAAVTLFAFTNKKEDVSRYLPVELKASDREVSELSPVIRRLANAGKYNSCNTLEHIFSISKKERKMAVAETGCDPVKAQIEVLKRNSAALAQGEWEVSVLEKNRNLRILRPKGGGNIKITVTGQKKMFRIFSVEEG